jgi:ABC-type enterochelin transport system substrate-binding protein
MKILSLVLIQLLFIGMLVSQEASKIKPVKIVWVADGDTIDIDEAQRGIAMPGNLEIAVVFDVRTIGKLNGQKIEFKWFRKGATKDYLTNSFYEVVNSSLAGPDAYTLSSSRGELKKGWWKVQIEAYADRNLLAYRNKQVFWINLK